jgi:hypothetical protein
MTQTIETARPTTDETGTYFIRYVKLVPDGPILEALARQPEETLALVHGLGRDRLESGYAPGKWSVLDVLGHVIDSERIFAYRALRGARGDETPLPGYDEGLYAPAAKYNERTLDDVVAEFRSVRAATLTLFAGLPREAWDRFVTANDSRISVRALAWTLAGHELHHRAVLREKYGL